MSYPQTITVQYFIPFSVPPVSHQIGYDHKILLIGSCFTEHIGNRLDKYGWHIIQNPTGVIFNPNSIRKAIDRIVMNQLIHTNELVYHNELYHHWDFHSSYSHIHKEIAAAQMNVSIQTAHNFLLRSEWLIVTLGSAYQYFLRENDYGVSNCHRMPSGIFEKRMLKIEEIKNDLIHIRDQVQAINPNIKILLTISPVRHIKDGVIENNISKARLIEAVHAILDQETIMYYPAYELMIDVLRDYRFYDVDMVHPNYAATQTVWEFLVAHYFDDDARIFLEEILDLQNAYQHRTRFPETEAHHKFLLKYQAKVADLQLKYPHWDAKRFKDYFSSQ